MWILLFAWIIQILSYTTTYNHPPRMHLHLGTNLSTPDVIILLQVLPTAPTSLDYNKSFDQGPFASLPRAFVFIHEISNSLGYSGYFGMSFNVNETYNTHCRVAIEDQKQSIPRLKYAALGLVYWDPTQFHNIVFDAPVYYNYLYITPIGIYPTTLNLTTLRPYCFLSRIFKVNSLQPYFGIHIQCSISATSVNSIQYNFTFSENSLAWDFMIVYVVVKDDDIELMSGNIISYDWTFGAAINGVDVTISPQILIVDLIGFKCKNPDQLNARLINSVAISTVYEYEYLSFNYLAIRLKPPILELINVSVSRQPPRIVNLTYDNPMNQLIDISNVSISSPQLVPNLTLLSNNTLIIIFDFVGDYLSEENFEVSLKWTTPHMDDWGATSSFEIPLCVQNNQQFISKRNTIGDGIYYLQLVYLGIFAISLICSKMIGLEMIITLQISLCCLIQIPSEYMHPLSALQYANGLNPLFQSFSEIQISDLYSELGFKYNFFSNLNLMLFVLLIPLLISLIMFLLYRKSKHFRKKPIFKRYAISFGFQWVLTLMLFNTFNIAISLVLHIKYTGFSSPVELILGSILLLVPALLSIIFIYHHKHLFEFHQQLDSKSRAKLSISSYSINLSQMYPLVMVVQFYLFALLLGIESQSSYGLYIAVVLAAGSFIYCVWVLPYREKYDNIRLVVHKGFDTIVLVLGLVVRIQLSDSSVCYKKIIYLLYPITIASILGIVCILSAWVIILRLIQWCKKKTPIDHQLFKLEYQRKKPQEIGITNEQYMKQNMFSMSREQILNMKRERKNRYQLMGIFDKARGQRLM